MLLEVSVATHVTVVLPTVNVNGLATVHSIPATATLSLAFGAGNAMDCVTNPGAAVFVISAGQTMEGDSVSTTEIVKLQESTLLEVSVVLHVIKIEEAKAYVAGFG